MPPCSTYKINNLHPFQLVTQYILTSYAIATVIVTLECDKSNQIGIDKAC
jgi:hypothetical protein